MNFNVNDLNLLAPELFLLGAICVILIADLFVSAERRGLTHFLALLSLVGCAVLTLRLPGAAGDAPRQMAFAGMFVRDGVGDVLKLFIYLSSALVFVYARPYLAARRAVERGVLRALPVRRARHDAARSRPRTW
jgi:NADH-quinone oxidoreductase subunit N